MWALSVYEVIAIFAAGAAVGIVLLAIAAFLFALVRIAGLSFILRLNGASLTVREAVLTAAYVDLGSTERATVNGLRVRRDDGLGFWKLAEE